jgi:hypothetical protein
MSRESIDHRRFRDLLAFVRSIADSHDCKDPEDPRTCSLYDSEDFSNHIQDYECLVCAALEVLSRRYKDES